ncbi:metal ABC transporter ATP-binding protein [Patescibacteria group bacterium]|nr:metal ABC transporter ATP-binding protein [Patescibacteria group bacterium]
MEPVQQETMLSVKGLSVMLKNARVLEDINFEIRRGDVLAVIGPNGAGKTTLFHALLGMVPYAGTITWKKDLRIGYVPQRMEIETDLPLTVFEFFRLRGLPDLSRDKAREALVTVGLPERVLDTGLGEISIGQRQRALIAWALLGKPDLLLFDEPTADVDVRGQESIYQLLAHLQEVYHLTIILISHDLNVVYKYAKQVLCLNHKKLCFGPPREVLSPDQLQKLYGGEHGFYHHIHMHGQEHEEGHHHSA